MTSPSDGDTTLPPALQFGEIQDALAEQLMSCAFALQSCDGTKDTLSPLLILLRETVEEVQKLYDMSYWQDQG